SERVARHNVWEIRTAHHTDTGIMQDIILEWARDARGYRLAEAVPPAPVPEPRLYRLADIGRADLVLLPEAFLASRPAEPGKPERIIRQGGSLVTYRPTETLDMIFNEFVNTTPNPDGVLDFVNRFGPLSDLGNKEEGEPVQDVIDLLTCTVELIDAWGETDK